MHATVKELRVRLKALLAAAKRGETVEITHRGKPCARLVGLEAEQHIHRPGRNPAFGLWADRAMVDVDDEVRRLRKPRAFGSDG